MTEQYEIWPLIRDARDACGWTNQKLSDESGVPESSVQKILTGKTLNPSFDSIVSMCRALKISVDKYCDIDTNASIDEITELRTALAIAEEKRKTAEAQRETAETKLQSQIHEYDQMVSAYEYRIDIAKDRTIWLRRFLIFCCSLIVMLILSLIGIIIYDLANPEIGWFRQIAAYFNAGLAKLTGKV